jgi:hypothetical protein
MGVNRYLVSVMSDASPFLLLNPVKRKRSRYTHEEELLVRLLRQAKVYALRNTRNVETTVCRDQDYMWFVS